MMKTEFWYKKIRTEKNCKISHEKIYPGFSFLPNHFLVSKSFFPDDHLIPIQLICSLSYMELEQNLFLQLIEPIYI